MAGKACVMGSGPLAGAIDELSKNTLIDILIDRAKIEIGEDNDRSSEENEERILDIIVGWAEPIALVRNDKMKPLRAALMKWRQAEDRYRRDTEAGIWPIR